VPTYSKRVQAWFENDVFPHIGKLRAADLKASDFLKIARKMEERQAFESAYRVMQNCSQVMRYAVTTDRAERNPVADLRGALVPSPERNHAAVVDPVQLGGLLRALMAFIRALNAVFNSASIDSTPRVTTCCLVTGKWGMSAMHPSMKRLYEAAERLTPAIRGQSELARAIGQSPQVVKNWEVRPMGVSAQGASKAQQALGISSTWILEGTLPMHVGGSQLPASQSAGLQRQIIATTVRLIDYVDDMVLDPIPDEDRERLIDIATAEVVDRWASGIGGEKDLATAGRNVVAKFRSGG